MRPTPLTVPARGEADPAARAVEILETRWRRGETPSIGDCWADCGPDPPVAALVGLIKADLRRRFELGERPTVAEYIDRFPVLCAHHERMLSLTYEEFCLLEERGERPDPDAFCARYEPWRSSLHSQLRYHAMLSRVVSPPGAIRYPEEGEWFGPCYLDRVLGRGGAAQVYLALDADLGVERALKVSADRGDEPKIQARLEHPHIVQVLNVIRQPESGLRGMCMPYRPALSLDRTVDLLFPEDGPARPERADALRRAITPKDGPTPVDPPGWRGFPDLGRYEEGAAWVVATVARALAYAHARGILHRDVKPANILLTVTDGPQLLDFNLAHAPNASEEAEAALRGGTLPYMAPEQLLAFLDPGRWDDVGPAADIYSLGLVLRELLDGKRPETPRPTLPLPRAIAEMLDRRTGRPAPLRAGDPTIPAELDRIVLRCLEPDPDRRYASADELADDLEAFVRVRTSRRAALARWARAHRRALIAGSTAAVLSAALLLVFQPRPARRPAPAVPAAVAPAPAGPRVDHEKLGDRAIADSKYPTAREHYEQALARLRGSSGDEDAPTVARLLRKIAQAAAAARDFPAAEARFREASRLIEDRCPDDRAQLGLVELERAINLCWWANWIESGPDGETSERLAKAATHYDTALQCLRRAEESGQPPDRFLIRKFSGICKIGLSMLPSKRDQLKAAREWLRDAEQDLKIAQGLDPEDAEVKLLLNSARNRQTIVAVALEQQRRGEPTAPHAGPGAD